MTAQVTQIERLPVENAKPALAGCVLAFCVQPVLCMVRVVKSLCSCAILLHSGLLRPAAPPGAEEQMPRVKLQVDPPAQLNAQVRSKLQLMLR